MVGGASGRASGRLGVRLGVWASASRCASGMLSLDALNVEKDQNAQSGRSGRPDCLI